MNDNGEREAPLEVKSGGTNEYVTFRMHEETFAFPMERVREIIRVPETVRVPLTPPSLLGLANLRGTVLPVLEMRRLLGLGDAARTDATRVIVTDCGNPVGLVVDRVDRVLSVNDSRIDSAGSMSGSVSSDVLTGVVKDATTNALLQLLDLEKIVTLELGALIDQGAMQKRGLEGVETSARASQHTTEDVVQLVSFVVQGEEYAFEIAQIEEIVRVPEDIRKLPRAEPHVLGLMNLRDRLLPLVSLRRMFQLSENAIGDRHRVIVANLRSAAGTRTECVGIVVDEVREVLTVPREHQRNLPPLLARGGELDEVTSVCRLQDGKRLISVISSDALFRHRAVQAAVEASREAAEEMEMRAPEAKPSGQTEETQLVVFQLAGEEIGAPIRTVSEIVRLPDRMTRVPKTPDFIDGMLNLRGTVLPVLDMRARFGISRAEKNDKQRILVLDVGGVRTGFVVDSVSEVLRVPNTAIEDSPHMSQAQARVMGKVANLTRQKRMILVLDIEQLLSSEEAEQIAAVK